MSTRSMPILDELEARGLLADVTDRAGLGELLAKGPVTFYVGYDPTSSSLHVGNLVPVMLQVRLQRAGHKPIVLVGGATGMIGDPSGKSTERNLMSDEELAHNLAGIRAQLERFLDFSPGPTGAILVNNADWTRPLGFLEFLRDVGKYLTVNYMMAKDSVRARLESETGISYTEFSYMLLQAFDFVHLSKTYGCRLQAGGSDQYGNITAGCELSRKMGGPQLYGLTAPLLLDSTGQKMGKTSTGERVWLDPSRTSPYAFYQYWLNVTDADAPRLLRLFSLRSLAEIEEILRTHDADRSQRVAQRELARALTSWVHGEAELARVEEASRVMFGGSLEGVKAATLELLASVVPVVEVSRGELAAGISIVDLLSRTVAESKSAARRLVQQGGAYVNNVRIGDLEHTVTTAHLATPTMLVVRGGRKDYRLVRVKD
ncbi:MAG TPA: tyrosine--tRNA ligase [Steroidobacteraceae bacterium]|nr:tyrosine--tRNA ligase [Steroidobacteraceae bacterium]